MAPAGIIGAIWIAIAVPIAVVVGRVITRGRREEKHPPGDEPVEQPARVDEQL